METPVEIPRALRDAAAALPKLYADPAHYDLLAQMTAPADLPYYRQRLAGAPASVLELGCGTGRVSLALAQDGHDVVGVELSPDMLAAAQRKALEGDVALTLALGDLRSFDLGRTFDWILVPYNTFNHLLDLDSIERCLATVKKHMSEGSRLVIDTFQPSLVFLGASPGTPRGILRFVDPYIDAETRLFEENHYDPATQINRVVWRYEVNGQPDARVEELSMRLFFPQELDALLTLSGLAIESKVGDYDERPFDGTSPKQLVTCRLP